MTNSLRVLLALFVFSAPAMAVDFDPTCYTTTNHQVFTSVFQRYVTAKHGDGLSTKTKYDPTAVALGYKYTTGNGWETGLTFSYETGNAKHDLRMTGADYRFKVRDRTYGFTLFGVYTAPTGWYTKGSAFVGFANQKLKNGHDSLGGRYRSAGSRSSTRFGASVEFGKIYDFGDGFRVTPHVGFDYAHAPKDRIRVHDYVNNSGSRLITDSQNFYEIPLGVGVAKDFVAADWVVTPSVDATLVSSFGNIKDENMNYRTGFASNVGSNSWKVYGVGADHWGGRVTAGIKAMKSDRFDVGLNYTYEGRKKYNDHRLAAVLGLKF